MNDTHKTKQQLIEELAVAKYRISELEAQSSELTPSEENELPEGMFRSLIESLPQNVFSKDLDGRVIYVNQSYCQTENCTPEDILGKTDFDVYPPEIAQKYREDDLRLMENDQTIDIIEEHPLPDGEMSYVQVVKTPLYDTQGQVRGMVGMFWDVTRLKRAEEDREHLQQEIIEAQQQAIVELSTPVIPIMDRIIVMPLIGSIDTMRARDITRSLLAGITQHRAKVVIVDVTGVSLMDTGIVNRLNKTIQAARLKGARTIVTGISDAVAEAIVDLGIDWSEITTLSDLQTGLIVALDSLGVKLSNA